MGSITSLNAALDYILIHAQYEDNTGRFQKELDRLQHFDSFFRKTTIQVIYKNDETTLTGSVNQPNRLFEHLLEFFHMAELPAMILSRFAADCLGCFFNVIGRCIVASGQLLASEYTPPVPIMAAVSTPALPTPPTICHQLMARAPISSHSTAWYTLSSRRFRSSMSG